MPVLRPGADGLLRADRLADVPIMAPRLQGELSPDGRLQLALWGDGAPARLRLEGLAGACEIAPGRVTAGGGELWVAQSQPVLAVRGVKPVVEHPPGAAVRLTVEARGDDWVVAMGATEAEAGRAAALGREAIVAEADAYAARCDQLPAADPVLRTMVIHGAHAALSSIRRHADGVFAGLSAGLAYSSPARTYYRDSYWTLQLLLRFAPDVVLAQIELLALRVQADGEAPSGVIVATPGAMEVWERLRLSEPVLAALHWRAGEWWSDHFDSPLFFVLAVADYVAATGDDGPARRHWPQLKAVFGRYEGLSGFDGLPVKPRNDRDWADNVFRQGRVAYDLGLWVGALDALARLGETHDPDLAARARSRAAAARAVIDPALWRGAWWADFLRPDGSAEEHLALDSLTLLRHEAVPDDRARQVLDQVRTRLESRRNSDQPCGDFGMLCVWPPYARRAELRGKSAFAYRYHNGADWPWLDGLYAGERLRRGMAGWRYPLTRWWEKALQNGWAGAVEYASPAFGRGSLLQGWSSLPAAVAIAYADQVLKDDPDNDEGRATLEDGAAAAD